MSLDGYIDYKRREFCNDIKCSVQLDLNVQEDGSEEHERSRSIVKNDCEYTTYQVHQWLIDKGYNNVRPEK